MNIFNADWMSFWETATRMSWFEIGMLICFGAGWPLSIYRMTKTKSSAGKSLLFLVLVMLGYFFGVCHKLFYHLDVVILLYLALFFVVMTDFFVCIRYRSR